MHLFVPDEIVDAWNKVGEYFQKIVGAEVPAKTPNEGSNAEVPSVQNEDGTWTPPQPEPVTLASEDEAGNTTAAEGVQLSATATGNAPAPEVTASQHANLETRVGGLESKLDAILEKLG